MIELEERLVAIEVKAAGKPVPSDARHLRAFLDEYGDAVHGSLPLDDGDDCHPLEDRVAVAPWWRVIRTSCSSRSEAASLRWRPNVSSETSSLSRRSSATSPSGTRDPGVRPAARHGARWPWYSWHRSGDMALPTYDQLIEPLLRHLATVPEGVRVAEAREAVAARVGVSSADRQLLLPSRNQPVYDNRVGWAHDRLKRAGLSTSARRGFWMLTERGHKYLEAHPLPLTPEEIDQLATVERGSRLRAKDAAPELDAPPTLDPVQDRQSPDERIESALAELRDAVSRELLTLIGDAPPEFFEVLVLELLHAIGYGTSKADVQRVGRSGDGGIDGVISLDKLGLEKVYVQAKRWQNNVGRPDVQSFFGALAGRRAKKGVFITTAGFTREARDFAQSVSDSIVLVDGERLTALMIEHGVGVSHQPLRVPHVDHDYFEEL